MNSEQFLEQLDKKENRKINDIRKQERQRIIEMLEDRKFNLLQILKLKPEAIDAVKFLAHVELIDVITKEVKEL